MLSFPGNEIVERSEVVTVDTEDAVLFDVGVGDRTVFCGLNVDMPVREPMDPSEVDLVDDPREPSIFTLWTDKEIWFGSHRRTANICEFVLRLANAMLYTVLHHRGGHKSTTII
jgi:hypothetical protein